MHSSFDDFFGRSFYDSKDSDILLPWVGSKRSLLNQISKYYPKSFNNYYEPFCGSLSVGYDVMNKFKKNSSFHFNDANFYLTSLYRNLSSSYEETISEIKGLYEKFSKFTTEEEEAQFYYEHRSEFNNNLESSNPRQSAIFYFLIKTSFQQLCRFNSKGEFNAPFGRGKNFVMDYDRLGIFHDKFKDATFTTMDFESFIRESNPTEGDFIYFDPPYDETFTSYTKGSFKDFDQERLANLVTELVNKGCYCLISNSRTELIEKLYSDFDIVDIYRNNKWQRVGNDKNKKNLECLIIANNIGKNNLY